MKKILLIIAIAFCIFQMVVLATAIDIGSVAENRGAAANPDVTYIDLSNPANDSGKITSVEIWANINLVGCEVATFFAESGTNYSTRDWEAIGDVPAGSKRTFVVDIDVEAGDFLGIYVSSGKVEMDYSGGSGLKYKNGDWMPCTDESFILWGSYPISLYGTGDTAPLFPIVKFSGVTITKWNSIEITKWNSLE